MSSPSDGDESSPKPTGLFTTTHWSVVLAAGHASSPDAQAALEQLCRTYWYPLYVYVRRKGHSPEDAADLTQAFFARLLAKEFLQGVSPLKGRFRTFLLTCLGNFLADAWDQRRAARRGGGLVPWSLDTRAGEERYRLEPADQLTAEALYERRWANTLLEHVIDRIRQESVAAGNEQRFDQLQDLLLGEHREQTYAEVAARLGTTEGAVKMAISRLRQRFREVLREEIAHTVAHPSEVDDEIRHLRVILGK